MIFEYGKKEAAYLRKKDEALGAYMKKRGFVGIDAANHRPANKRQGGGSCLQSGASPLQE